MDEIKYIHRLIREELGIQSSFPIPVELDGGFYGKLLSFPRARCMITSQPSKESSSYAFKLVNPVTNVAEFMVHIVPLHIEPSEAEHKTKIDLLLIEEDEDDCNNYNGLIKISDNDNKSKKMIESEKSSVSLEQSLDILLGDCLPLPPSLQVKVNNNNNNSNRKRRNDYGRDQGRLSLSPRSSNSRPTSVSPALFAPSPSASSIAALPIASSRIDIPKSSKRMLSILDKMYETRVKLQDNENNTQYYPSPSPVPSKHCNLAPLREVIISKNSQHALVVFDGSSPYSLEALSKYNRHALRFGSEARIHHPGEGEDISLDLTNQISGNNASSSSSQLLSLLSKKLGIPLIGKDPIQYNENDVPLKFIWYQLLHVLNFIHSNGIFHGALVPHKIRLTTSMWVQLDIVSPLCFIDDYRSEIERPLVSSNPTRLWVQGDISNFDYLMIINSAVGRRLGESGSYHPILPWVSDFVSDNASSYRDLRKSKFRLAKGDRQLDSTFVNSPQGTTHHIPESLSEITYFMYLARRTPLETLKKIVRSTFDAREYPSSLARLYEWTPDEAIPELYTDPDVFASIHGKDIMPNLDLPNMCLGNPERFVAWHREKLESPDVSRYLHKWIDINFGVSLSGKDAIDNMNVPLPLKSLPFFLLRKNPGFVQLFSFPHPTRSSHLYSKYPNMDYEALSNIIESAVDPNSKLIVDDKSAFVEDDFINWMFENKYCTNNHEAKEIIARLLKEKCISVAGESNNPTKYQVLSLQGSKYVKRDKTAGKQTGLSQMFNIAKREENLIRTDSSTLIPNYYEGIEHISKLKGKRFIEEMQKLDNIALCKVIAEVYLGRSVMNSDDLSLLPIQVCNILKKVIGSNKTNVTAKDLLDNKTLWPDTFEDIYQFLSVYNQKMTWNERLDYFASNVDNIQISVRNRGFIRRGAQKQTRQHLSVENLLLPTAVELMEETVALGGIGRVFCALHPYCNEQLLLQITNNILDKALAKDQWDALKNLPALFFQGRLLEFVFTSTNLSSDHEKILKGVVDSLSSLSPESIARTILPSILERWKKVITLPANNFPLLSEFAAKASHTCGENIITALFLPQAVQLFDASCSNHKWSVSHDILDSFVQILPHLKNHETARNILRSCHVPKSANESVIAKYYLLRDAVVNAIVESASSGRKDTATESSSFQLSNTSSDNQNRFRSHESNNRRGSFSVIRVSEQQVEGDDDDDDDDEDDFNQNKKIGNDGKVNNQLLKTNSSSSLLSGSKGASSGIGASSSNSKTSLANSPKITPPRKLMDDAESQAGDENVWILGGERKQFRRLTAHKCLAHPTAGVSVIEAPEYSYQTTTILTGSRDGEVCMWDIYHGAPRERLRFRPLMKDRSVNSLRYNHRLLSPDILVGDGLTLSQWDAETSQCVMHHVPGVACFEPIPIENGIFVGTHNGEIGILDSRESIKSISLYRLLSPTGIQFPAFTPGIRSLKLLSHGNDGNLFACGRDLGQITFVDIRSPGKIINSFTIPNAVTSNSPEPITKIFDIKPSTQGFSDKNFNIVTVCGVSTASLWEIPCSYLSQPVEKVRVQTDITLTKLSPESRETSSTTVPQDIQYSSTSSAFPSSSTIPRDGSNTIDVRRRYSVIATPLLQQQQQYIGDNAVSLICSGGSIVNSTQQGINESTPGNPSYPEIYMASSNKIAIAPLKVIPSKLNDLKIKAEAIFDGTRGKRFRRNELQINSLSFLDMRDLFVYGASDGFIHAMI